MSDKIRLAQVGLGRWARVLARGAQRGDLIDIHSCYSRSEEKRTAFMEEYGIARSHESYESLLADPDIEGIIITTPNDTHRPLIVQALEAGMPVYTDKPVAQTLEDAAAIKEAVTSTGLPFAVGHSARRLSGNRQMKRWIDDGTLGGVSMAEANFSNERGLELTPETWRWYLSKTPGGPLIQLGVHHADNLQYLLGPVAAVTSHTRKLFTKSEVPDATMTILEFESGALGYLGCGWASPGIYQIRLQGTKANLMYDLDFTHWDEAHEADDRSTLVSQAYGDQDREPVELPRTDMFREQLEEFAKACRAEGSIEVGIDDAIRALSVVHCAIESNAQGGKAVEVKPFLERFGI